jgi:hypothetical protein
MSTQTNNPSQFNQPPMIEALTAIRQEWEQAAEKVSLLEISGSIGLLLVDFTEALGLSQAERKLILGDALFTGFQEI